MKPGSKGRKREKNFETFYYFADSLTGKTVGAQRFFRFFVDSLPTACRHVVPYRIEKKRIEQRRTEQRRTAAAPRGVWGEEAEKEVM